MKGQQCITAKQAKGQPFKISRLVKGQ